MVAKDCSKSVTAQPRGVEQPGHLGVTAGVLGIAAPVDLAEPVVQRVDQQLAPARIVEQVLLEVRVAVHHPDVAQHLVEHARRTPGAALGAQVVEQLPALVAQQPDDDLAVGERRVVVGDLAQPDGRIERNGIGPDQRFGLGIHDW